MLVDIKGQVAKETGQWAGAGQGGRGRENVEFELVLMGPACVSPRALAPGPGPGRCFAFASDLGLAWTLDPAPASSSASVCSGRVRDGAAFFFQGQEFLGPGPTLPTPGDLPRAGRLTPALALICDIYVLTIHAVPAASLTGFFQPRPAPAGLLGRPDLVQAECPRPAPPVVTAPPPWPALIWAQGGSTLGQALSVCLSVPRRLVARSPSGQRVPCSKVLTLLTLHSPLQDTRLSYGHSCP